MRQLEWQWLIGIMVSVAIFLFGLWWKIEARQDKKIDDLAERNDTSHRAIHDKMDRQHATVYERIMEIWSHLKKRDD